MHGLEVGGHLLAQGPIEQPGGGLAERPAAAPNAPAGSPAGLMDEDGTRPPRSSA